MWTLDRKRVHRHNHIRQPYDVRTLPRNSEMETGESKRSGMAPANEPERVIQALVNEHGAIVVLAALCCVVNDIGLTRLFRKLNKTYEEFTKPVT